jgi:LPXTG-motif cell wall-anchored protein
MAVPCLRNGQKSLFRAALCTCACALLTTGVWAQDASETTTQKGPASYQTTERSGTVVYSSGNDLVVRGQDGAVKHFVVPESQTFNVDGQQLNVHQLKPGTVLTQTITTRTVPTTVKTVRTIDGRVWHVNPPSTVILTLPDNTNQQYTVPPGQMFMINGREQSVFHLRRGMNVSATVVTEEPVTTVSQTTSVAGVAPPPPPAQPMPDRVAILLIQSPTPAPQPTETAAAEPAPKALPKTGSEWPLVGLLGLVSLGAGAVTRKVRLSRG